MYSRDLPTMAVFQFEQLSLFELQKVRTVRLAVGPTGIYDLVSCLQRSNNASKYCAWVDCCAQ